MTDSTTKDEHVPLARLGARPESHRLIQAQIDATTLPEILWIRPFVGIFIGAALLLASVFMFIEAFGPKGDLVLIVLGLGFLLGGIYGLYTAVRMFSLMRAASGKP